MPISDPIPRPIAISFFEPSIAVAALLRTAIIAAREA
jgi:hypothetical protein